MTIRQLVEDKIPRQVMFYDGESMCAGILYGEQIICGCCGGVFDAYDVVTMARDACAEGEEVVAIKLFDTWMDISDEIKGSEADTASAIALEDTEAY